MTVSGPRLRQVHSRVGDERLASYRNQLCFYLFLQEVEQIVDNVAEEVKELNGGQLNTVFCWDFRNAVLLHLSQHKKRSALSRHFQTLNFSEIHFISRIIRLMMQWKMSVWMTL